MLIAITFIDIDHFIIPNEFIIFGLIVSFFAHALIFYPYPFYKVFMVLLHLEGLCLLWGRLGHGHLKKGSGLRGCKTRFVLGSFLGVNSHYYHYFEFIFAAIMSIILLIAKEVGEDRMIPFGPNIAAGTLLAILTRTIGGGNHIINWYFTNMWNVEYIF